MMTNEGQVLSAVRGALGTAYLGYPEKRIPRTGRWAVVILASVQSLEADRHGEDLATALTYRIDVYAKGERDNLDACDDVVRALAPLHIALQSMSPLYRSEAYGMYRTLMLTTTLDKRSISYRG